jgi:surface polysaccharide O-acyltransferase-like enzyme
MKRNIALDSFRIFASLMVICLHCDYGLLNNIFVDIIKVSSRWAVPFFFMTTGLFLYKKEDKLLTFPEKKITHLISIHLISSLIFIFVKIINNENLKFGLVNLLNGTYYHLWYVGSSVIGIILIWYISKIGLYKKLLLISVAILIITLLTDGYDIIINKNIKYMPFLLSISFIAIGHLISKKNIKKNINILGLFLLFIFQFLENYTLRIFSDKYENYRIFITTIMFSILLVSFLNKVKSRSKIITFLASLGVKYSLFVYLYHPIFIILLSVLINKKTFLNKYINIGFQPLIIFIITIFTGIIINKYFSRLFKVLNGNIKL